MAHPQSEETRRKISQSNMGRKITTAQRLKQSRTRKKLFRQGKLKIPWAGKSGIVTWNKKGPGSTSWKGGRQVDKNGYIWLRKPDHPNANSHGMVAEHRLIMARVLGRSLFPWENVHHRNAVKDDNRIENLAVVSKGVHHGKIACPYCHRAFFIR